MKCHILLLLLFLRTLMNDGSRSCCHRCSDMIVCVLVKWDSSLEMVRRVIESQFNRVLFFFFFSTLFRSTQLDSVLLSCDIFSPHPHFHLLFSFLLPDRTAISLFSSRTVPPYCLSSFKTKTMTMAPSPSPFLLYCITYYIRPKLVERFMIDRPSCFHLVSFRLPPLRLVRTRTSSEMNLLLLFSFLLIQNEKERILILSVHLVRNQTQTAAWRWSLRWWDPFYIANGTAAIFSLSRLFNWQLD